MKIKRVCGQCGKEFETFPSRLKDGKGKYCSKKCHNNSMKKREKRLCLNCEIVFETKPSSIQKFCCLKCSNSYNRLHQIFKKNHTKPELIFEEICKKHNLHFKYTGDGSLWIGKQRKINPDFIQADGRKIVIEIFGDYWHSPLLNPKLSESANLNYRKRHYIYYKWHPVFIWGSDLLREDAEQFILNTLQREGVI